MSTVFRMVSLVVIIVASASCERSQKNDNSQGIRTDYSLCPKSLNAKNEIGILAQKFATENSAQLFNRSIAAQSELSQMTNGEKIIISSGGKIILITIEKPNEFRISLANTGLKEKLGMSIRHWGESKDNRLTDWVANVGRFWEIERVNGGVEDSPPCISAARALQK